MLRFSRLHCALVCTEKASQPRALEVFSTLAMVDKGVKLVLWERLKLVSCLRKAKHASDNVHVL